MMIDHRPLNIVLFCKKNILLFPVELTFLWFVNTCLDDDSLAIKTSDYDFIYRFSSTTF